MTYNLKNPTPYYVAVRGDEAHTGTWDHNDSARLYTKAGASAAVNRLNRERDRALEPFDKNGNLARRLEGDRYAYYNEEAYKRDKLAHENRQRLMAAAGPWRIAAAHVVLTPDPIEEALKAYIEAQAKSQTPEAVDTVVRDIMNIIKSAQ